MTKSKPKKIKIKCLTHRTDYVEGEVYFAIRIHNERYTFATFTGNKKSIKSLKIMLFGYILEYLNQDDFKFNSYYLHYMISDYLTGGIKTR